MSARKPKKTSDVRQIYTKLIDVVTKVKAGISSHQDGEVSPDLYDNISRGAALAERLFDQRGRTGDDWEDVADELDDEGTKLWNMSSLVRQLSDDVELFGMLRLLGFRMIQAGVELEPPLETLMHLVQLASKAGSALSGAGKHDVAASVLSSAATYEESLRSSLRTLSSAPPGERCEDADMRRQLKRRGEQAMVLYFASRMEAAFKQGNEGVASYMLDKITETDKHLLSSLSAQELTALAHQVALLGKSNLVAPAELEPITSTQEDLELPAHQNHKREEARRALEASKYLQRAYTLVELAEAKVEPRNKDVGGIAGASLDLGNLKRTVLRALARAYYHSHTLDPENYARAEITVDELIQLLDADPAATKKEEYQQCRWMRVHLLKHRDEDGQALQSSIFSVIDHMMVSEKDVNEVIIELRTHSPHPKLVAACAQHLLNRTLQDDQNYQNDFAQVAQVLLWMIFQYSRVEDAMQGVADIATALDAINNAEISLPVTPAAACLTLLWQAAERHYTAKHYPPAAALYQLGAHKCISALGEANINKCLRKAAMCYLQSGEFSRAAQVVRRGDERCREAGTCFVLFLVAAEQGLEDEASRAIGGIVAGVDFDVRMLRLAVQKAREKRLRETLLFGLEALLEFVRGGREGGAANIEGIEAITLVRSVIRLAKELLGQPGSNRPTLVQSLLKYFDVAKELVEDAFKQRKESAIVKDIDWLWRVAYNLGIQGCSEWQDAVEDASHLFDYAKNMLDFRARAALVDVDEEIHIHMLYASYAALTGRVLAYNDAEGRLWDETKLHALLAEVQDCRKTVEQALSRGQITQTDALQRVVAFMEPLQIWTVKFCAALKDWDKSLAAIEDLTQASKNQQKWATLATFEAMADIFYAAEDCPYSVLLAALEAILHTSLDAGSLSIEKFSRWLRSVCTLLVARDSEVDRLKAVEYVEQALLVMEEHANGGSREYPVEECQWLLATTFNTGIEAFSAGFVAEAKRWLECATQICRFVPYGQDRAEKVSQAYRTVLARLSDV